MGFIFSRTKEVFAVVLGGLLVLSCTPQQINMKDRIIEHPNPATTAKLTTDIYAYDLPSGPVDVIMVQDNTESLESAANDLETFYRTLGSELVGDEARLLDSQMSWISSPGMLTPKSVATRNEGLDTQLDEIYKPHTDHLSNFKERGYIVPLNSTTTLLQGDRFAGRDRASLWVVYFLGDESRGDASAGVLDDFIVGKRGEFQSFAWAFAKRSAGSPAPRCASASPATQTLTSISNIKWKNFTERDLCAPGLKDQALQVWEEIYEFKRRVILSEIPYKGNDVTAYSRGRRLYFERDFDYIAEHNELIFKPEARLKKGDSLEVTYLSLREYLMMQESETPIDPPQNPPPGSEIPGEVLQP